MMSFRHVSTFPRHVCCLVYLEALEDKTYLDIAFVGADRSYCRAVHCLLSNIDKLQRQQQRQWQIQYRSVYKLQQVYVRSVNKACGECSIVLYLI